MKSGKFKSNASERSIEGPLEFLKAITDLLKSVFEPRIRRWISVVFVGVSAVAILAPLSWFTAFSLEPLSPSARTKIAGIGVIGVVGLVAELFLWIGGRISRVKRNRHARARLRRLTIEEKQILCGYILGGQRTQYFSVEDGVVAGLLYSGIIFQSSSVGHLRRGFSFNIQSWAWDYLQDHHELIVSEDMPRNEQSYLLPYAGTMGL
jgi:Super-infection exclusion protein B